MSKGADRPKDDPEAPWNRQHRPRGGRKDTRTWCRGKVGTLHTPEIVKQSWARGRPCRSTAGMGAWMEGRKPWMCWHQRQCLNCGKVLEHFLPWDECPDVPKELLTAP